jgi:carbon monoxide dehydrogenase subunit G
MEIEESFVVKAPLQKVWGFLVDNPAKLISYIPGCEKIEPIDEKTYCSVIKAKVGPIVIRFEFQTTLTEMGAPRFLKTVGKGVAKGIAGRLGEFHHESDLELREVSHTQTQVHYKAKVNVTGKLAIFGSDIMMAKAKEMGKTFVLSVKDNLEREVV